MKFFVICFILIVLAYIGVDRFIPSDACFAVPAELVASLSQCCVGFLLLGLLDSFFYRMEEFMGLPIGLIRIVYVVILVIVFLLFNSGVPATPENIQNCDIFTGGY